MTDKSKDSRFDILKEARSSRIHRRKLTDLTMRATFEAMNDPELKELKDRDAPFTEITRHPKVRQKIEELRRSYVAGESDSA